MSSFNIGDVFRLRHGRHKMAFSEAMAMKSSDLQQALVNGTAACRLNVEGKQVCLQAYCMLYNLNWSYEAVMGRSGVWAWPRRYGPSARQLWRRSIKP